MASSSIDMDSGPGWTVAAALDASLNEDKASLRLSTCETPGDALEDVKAAVEEQTKEAKNNMVQRIGCCPFIVVVQERLIMGSIAVIVLLDRRCVDSLSQCSVMNRGSGCV